jgi:plasmid stabilization system protein ParE
MSTLRISKRAHRDLSEIEEYDLKDDPFIADLVMRRLYATLRMLADNPHAATSFVIFQCEAE